MQSAAIHALTRFGLGAGPAALPPADPRAWLAAQLDGPDPALNTARFRALPTGAAALGALRADAIARRAVLAAGEPLKGHFRSRSLAFFTADARAALDWAVVTPAPFRERLVWFWTNHFTVSIRQGGTLGLVGPFIREAIRSHVTGRFTDMVLAAERHPAMLLYLSNAYSVGPQSPVGRRTGRGLNENLGRECMELHTVSLAARYTQADVTSMAKLLTGWSVSPASQPDGFLFRPLAHEPGPQTVMGQEFPPGEEGGLAALRFLSTYKTTWTALAEKLVRHFVADDPPPGAVRRIEAVLTETGGDLHATSLALIDLPEAWQPLAKLKTPLEYSGVRPARHAARFPRRAPLLRRPPQARPAALGGAAAQRLVRPCRRLGRLGRGARPHRLRLQPSRAPPRGRPAGARRRRARPDAPPANCDRDPPRRLARRRDEPPFRRSRVPAEMSPMKLTRRRTLLGLPAVLAAGPVTLALADAATERRFVVVLLRGALDGMAAVVPYGDPNLRALRAGLVPLEPGQGKDSLLDLGGFFALHPALSGLHTLYRDGELLPVHAIAGPYRTRSHFEAQDLIQTGATETETAITSGWLNRVLLELPSGGHAAAGTGLAVGVGMPLLLRGKAMVGSYAPAGFAAPSPDLYRRIAALNAPDPLLGPAIAEGLAGAAFRRANLRHGRRAATRPARRLRIRALAMQAGKLLAAPAGPRIAAFQLEGWDTHGNQVSSFARRWLRSMPASSR